MEKAQGEKKKNTRKTWNYSWRLVTRVCKKCTVIQKYSSKQEAYMVIFRYVMLYENISYTTTIRSFQMGALFSPKTSKKKKKTITGISLLRFVHLTFES